MHAAKNVDRNAANTNERCRSSLLERLNDGDRGTTLMKKRRYLPKAKPVTPSLFGEHPHRWPEAGQQLAYAMACVEVVANNSPRAAELYSELVKAWAAPELKAFYHEVMGSMPAAEVQDFKETLLHPELVWEPDPNKPPKTTGTRPIGRIPVCCFSDTDAARAPQFNYHCTNMGIMTCT